MEYWMFFNFKHVSYAKNNPVKGWPATDEFSNQLTKPLHKIFWKCFLTIFHRPYKKRGLGY